LIAGVFALCGLVERAGQGMNLMYELCAKEAKSLPDFKESDPFFVRLTLNGLIRDEKLILLFKKIGNDIVNDFITEDYIIIYNLFFGEKISGKLRSRVKHLAEIGIVEHLGRGKYVLAKYLYEAIHNLTAYIVNAGLNRGEMKDMVENFIKLTKIDGASLNDLIKFLPNHTRSQIQKLLFDLRSENRIKTEGKANKAKWYIV